LHGRRCAGTWVRFGAVPAGVPDVKIATAEQMRALDQAAMERGVPGRVLMENAGRAVAQAVAERAAEMGGTARVVVVAGRGNNGGDGLVAARLLHNRGFDVWVYLLAAGDELTGDAAENYVAARAYGVPMVEQPTLETLREACAQADIIVDAILGTGIRGEVRGPARQAIEAINASAADVVAIDLPSGVDSDTGAICGDAVAADITLALALPKVGNLVYPGAGLCGELRVVDIGLPPDAVAEADIPTHLITAELAELCLPARWADMHKGDAGRVLIVAGSRGYTGAAALTAMGALRAGAGLVYLSIPESLNPILEAKCTEPITLPMPETEGASLSSRAAEEALEHAATCQAVALGPGIGRHPETAQLVQRLVAAIEAPLVIDADGLNCLADVDPGVLTQRPGPTIITPHPGELARLLQADVPTLQADRLGSARAAAGLFRCVVVFKGAGTIVARPDGQAWINATGNHGMASAGMGDVLTGVIAGFLAGGASPEQAAIAGVYYHGRAADLAAEGRDPRSIIASDLLDGLGRAMVNEELAQ
ncbi:MAG: NAD(P)H-hydrate dehydratase, partial [Armatimonadetes bacterium]|nr:NAD(P)H-hydrate dehydratase [Armatimonadota bacterium]